jgi:hypothetical protein
MTHHSNHPGQQLTTLPFHPKPAHHQPKNPVHGGTVPSYPHLPTRTSESPEFIPGRSSVGPVGANPKLLAGHTGQLIVRLGGATHTGSSESTRAHLHAQAILTEIQKELGSLAGLGRRSGRLPMLQKQLDHDLQIIERQQTQASTAAAGFS